MPKRFGFNRVENYLKFNDAARRLHHRDPLSISDHEV